MSIRKWLITKLAGDTLVVINATMIYKYYPIFADQDLKPILANNILLPNEMETPFLIYGSHIFEDIDCGELRIKEKYKIAYEKVIEEIKEKHNMTIVDKDKPVDKS